jgi:hypothetical protein
VKRKSKSQTLYFKEIFLQLYHKLGVTIIQKMDDNSGEFSDELDEFEESIDETKQKNLRNQTTFSNKPYDEAFEVSQDLSVNESFDGREKAFHFLK